MKYTCEESVNIERIIDTKVVDQSNANERFYKVQLSAWISENYMKVHCNDLVQDFWKNKTHPVDVDVLASYTVASSQTKTHPVDVGVLTSSTVASSQTKTHPVDVGVLTSPTVVSNQTDSMDFSSQTDPCSNKQDTGSNCNNSVQCNDAVMKLQIVTTKRNRQRPKLHSHSKRGPSTRRKNPSKSPTLSSDKEVTDDTPDAISTLSDTNCSTNRCPVNENSSNASDIARDTMLCQAKTHQEEQANGSESVFKAPNLSTIQETKTKANRTVTCKDCGAMFNNSFYKEKCRYCTNTCCHCLKSFKRPSALRNHMEGVHEKAKKHRCEICSKCFTTRHYLTNHILKHKNTRNHECDICHKRYKDITKLKRHKLIHTGVKPYKCDICQREFQQNEALKKHALLHTDGPRRFQCPLCKKGFNHKVSLKSHMLKHHDKNEQQAAVMIGLWKKYQQTETNGESFSNHQNDVLSKALNDVVMIPQDNRQVPLETDVNPSLPLLNFGSSLSLP